MVSGAVVGAGIAGAGQAPAVSLIAQDPPIRAFYVDATGGNDANSGLAPWDAWLTLAKVNGETFDPYDVIRLQGTFRETLTLPSSGADGRPITIEVYGAGATISGADVVTGWALDAGNVYSVAWATTNIAVVAEDGTRLAPSVDRPSMVQSSFFLDAGADVLYVWASDDADPDTHSMEVSARTNVIDGNGQDYIALRNINLTYAAGNQVALVGAAGWDISGIVSIAPVAAHINSNTTDCGPLLIRDCTFNDAGEESVYLDTASVTTGNLSIINNTFIGGGWSSGEGDGVDVKANNTAVTVIENNTFTYDASVDLSVHGNGVTVRNTAIIENNIITNPVRGGVNLGANSDACIVRYNTVIQNRAGGALILHGIEISAGDDHQIYYNLFVMNGDTTNDNNGIHGGFGVNHDGLGIYNNVVYGHERAVFNTGDLTNCDLKNNVFYEYTDAGIRTGAGTPTSLDSDNNDFYSTQVGADVAYVGGVTYTTLANWQGHASSPDANSIDGDPLFTSPSADLTLQSGSPCRNAGADVGLTTDYSGVDVPQETNPAIGAREYVP